MKTNITATIACLTLGLMVTTGCATKQYDRAAKASNSVIEARSAIEDLKVHMTETFTALNELITRPQPDLRKQYKQVASAMKALESSADKIAKRNESMNARGEALFTQWETEMAAINDIEIQTISAEQHRKAKESFDKIRAAMTGAEQAFGPMIDTLRQVVAYLEMNLNTAGVQAIAPRVDTMKPEAVKVRDNLNVVIGELNKWAAALSPKTIAQ